MLQILSNETIKNWIHYFFAHFVSFLIEFLMDIFQILQNTKKTFSQNGLNKFHLKYKKTGFADICNVHKIFCEYFHHILHFCTLSVYQTKKFRIFLRTLLSRFILLYIHDHRRFYYQFGWIEGQFEQGLDIIQCFN